MQIPLKHDLKTVIDRIEEAYKQLSGSGCYNIVFLCTDAWWINDTDVEDAVHELFVRSRDADTPQYLDLQAVIFYGARNYVFENSKALRKMHGRLKRLIQTESNVDSALRCT